MTSVLIHVERNNQVRCLVMALTGETSARTHAVYTPPLCYVSTTLLLMCKPRNQRSSPIVPLREGKVVCGNHLHCSRTAFVSHPVLPFSILQRRSCRHTSKPFCSRSCDDCIFSVTFHLIMRSSFAAPVQFLPARVDATCIVLLKRGIRVHLPTTPSSPFDRVFFDLHARSHCP